MNELSVRLEDIEECFQGVIPSALCTCSLEGIPNVCEISIVHRLDSTHVGLSRQFFNKTIANMQANPRAQVSVFEPTSGRIFHLDLMYEHTETEGPLFDRVKTVLDAVASHEGMASVFKLAAVDVCRVVACERVQSDWDQSAPRREVADMDALDLFSAKIGEATDVEQLVNVALDACAEVFHCDHSFILMLDEAGEKLYTVGSRGYEDSGIGAEVVLGEGVIGVAAQRRQSIRVGNMRSDLAYVHAVRSSMERAGGGEQFEKDIPLPGLADTLSQLAVPIIARDQLLGVLCLQSEVAGRFTARDEAALNVAARQIALSIMVLRWNRDREPMIIAAVEKPEAPQSAVDFKQVKYYPLDDSVFVGNEYVIKGVAGRVLWRLLQTYHEEQRVEFTNKEIRLDPFLDLPDIKDNLEARLILLRRRLEERCNFLQIQNTGRGRFRLDVRGPIELREVTA
jgi:adenylate cyclase